MSWNNNVQSATHDGLEVAADRDKKSQVLLIFDRENMPHNLFILANLNWNDRNMYLEYLFLVTRVHKYDVSTTRLVGYWSVFLLAASSLFRGSHLATGFFEILIQFFHIFGPRMPKN